MRFLFRHKTVLLLFALCALLFLMAEHWKEGKVIRGDAHGYSAYLASWVVYHNFDFSFYESLSVDEKGRYWLDDYEGAKSFPKYTMGLAYAQLPLYLLCHQVSGLMGWPQDGWTPLYHLSVGLSGLLVFFFGLLALDVWLRRRFSVVVSSLALALLVLASNLLYYASYENATAHQYLFSFFSITLWAFDTWLLRRTWPHLVLAAFFFGWLVLIRPTNAVFVLVPLVQLLRVKNAWRALLHWPLMLVLPAFVLPLFPQMMLWKIATGSWFFYSYGEEQIFWSNPHIAEGLFSFRNGWLLYTPVMVLAIVGLFSSWKIDSSLALATTLVLPIHVYIVFSWWCWYYGSSLSIRPMIDLYPLLAFSLASAVRWGLSKKWIAWAAFAVVAVLLVANNVIQSWQYHRGHLSGSDMTAAAFRLLFFNTDPPSNMDILGLFSAPDNERLLQGLSERTTRDTIVEKEWTQDNMPKGLKVSPAESFTTVLAVPAAQFETSDDRIMQVTATVRCDNYEHLNAHLVVSFSDSGLNYGYYTVELHKLHLQPMEWQHVNAYLKKPKDLPATGQLETYLWLQSGQGTVEVMALRVRQLDCPF